MEIFMSMKIHQTLLDLERAILAPNNRANTDFLMNILTPDFLEIGASGTRYTRANIIEHLRDEPGFDGPRSVENFFAKPLSEDTWIVNYRIPETTTQRTSIWQKRGGEWKMRFHQGTVEQKSKGLSH